MRLIPLLAVALVLVAAAPAKATEPVFGMNAGGVFYGAFDGRRWERHFAAMEQDGIRLVRSDAYWEDAEPDPPVGGVHTYDWAISDLHMRTLQRHAISWQPVLAYSAEWASSDPGHSQLAPPSNPDDYAAYAAAFAQRYGRGGTF